MNTKQAEAAKRLKERTAKKRFKFPEGETVFRVLPNVTGQDKLEYLEYNMHSGVGPRKSYVRCGKKALGGGGSCWLCDDTIPKLEASNKASHRQLAEAMARRGKFATQIAVREADETYSGPYFVELPQSVANQLLGFLSHRDISHPTQGYNLILSRSGTGKTDTRYSSLERDEEPSEVPEDLIEKAKPFSELVRRYDEAAMQAAYYGQEVIEEPDSETGEPAEAEVKPARRRPAEPIEEDEPEPVVVARSNGKPKARAPEPEEAEPEWTDDEVTEEALAEEFEEVPELTAPVASTRKAAKPTRHVEEEEPEPTQTVRGKTSAKVASKVAPKAVAKPVGKGRAVAVADDDDF